MVDKKTIHHIAKLARLEINDEQANQYSTQLSSALGYFEQISKLDTEGVEPLITPIEIENFWREDVAAQEHKAEEILANAPSKTGHLFKVPPVV